MERLVVAQKSDRGLKRAVNEDTCDFRIPAAGTDEARFGALFVVADGVGSMGSGDHASHAAVETLLDSYYDPELDDEDPRERLIAAIQDAHEAVLARVRAHDGRSLGTTLVGAAVLPSGRVVLFNVGDSRIYRVRGRGIDQLTADQSAVDPRGGGDDRAKLTAYVGQPRPIVPQVDQQQLQPGDTLVICSDGLWGLVEAADIANVVRANPPSVAVERLVDQVYAKGARDNVTVMLIQYGGARRRGRVFVLLIAIAVVLAAGLAVIQLRQNPAATDPAGGDITAVTVEAPSAQTEAAPATDNGGSLLIVRTPTIEAQ